MANCCPWYAWSPLATISMRLPSRTASAMFMSARATLRATVAPASRHMRATACSSAGARAARAPELAHAALWSPCASRSRPHAHRRGAMGSGRRRSRRRATLNCSLGSSSSGVVEGVASWGDRHGVIRDARCQTSVGEGGWRERRLEGCAAFGARSVQGVALH